MYCVLLCHAEQVQQQQQAELRAKLEANRLTLQEAQQDLSIKMEQYEEEVSSTACRASAPPAQLYCLLGLFRLLGWSCMSHSHSRGLFIGL